AGDRVAFAGAEEKASGARGDGGGHRPANEKTFRRSDYVCGAGDAARAENRADPRAGQLQTGAGAGQGRLRRNPRNHEKHGAGDGAEPACVRGHGGRGAALPFLGAAQCAYEGDAAGETFNFQSKTDILIRKDGKNVFIAECKFWKGEKAFGETLDQLLSYLSWRDTKTAVVLFNRNAD